MNHPCIQQIRAEIDDTRGLLVDVVDARPADATRADINHLDAARQNLNLALWHIQQADETYKGEHRE